MIMQLAKLAEEILINISSYMNIMYIGEIGRCKAPVSVSRYHKAGWLVWFPEPVAVMGTKTSTRCLYRLMSNVRSIGEAQFNG